MNSLLVKNITIFGHCGITNGERSTGALFQIDAEVFWHGTIGDDALESTVDYEALYEKITGTFRSRQFKLIETAAQAIADSILDRFPLVEEVYVGLRKRPPMDAALDFVEIRITRRR